MTHYILQFFRFTCPAFSAEVVKLNRSNLFFLLCTHIYYHVGRAALYRQVTDIESFLPICHLC